MRAIIVLPHEMCVLSENKQKIRINKEEAAEREDRKVGDERIDG